MKGQSHALWLTGFAKIIPLGPKETVQLYAMFFSVCVHKYGKMLLTSHEI